MGDPTASNNPTYSRAAVGLHWVSAILIIGLWPFGKIMVGNKDQSWAINAIRAHTVIGLVVGLLTVSRLIVHFVGPKVNELEMPTWERILFKVNHFLLYAAVVLSVITGLLMYREAGASLPFSGNVDPRTIGKGNDWADRHELPANLMMIMFVMHVAGVLFFQVTKGRTLRRMGVPVGEPIS